MDGMFFLLDVIIVCYGVYAVYGALNIRKGGTIPSALWSKEYPMTRCKDKEGFITFMYPRLVAFGVLVTICGIVSVINDRVKTLSALVTMVPTIIIIPLLIVLIRWSRKKKRANQ